MVLQASYMRRELQEDSCFPFLPHSSCCRTVPLQPKERCGNKGTMASAAWWLPGKWLLADGGPSTTLAATQAFLGFLTDRAVKPDPCSSLCPSFRGASSTGHRRRRWWHFHLYGLSLCSSNFRLASQDPWVSAPPALAPSICPKWQLEFLKARMERSWVELVAA